LQEFLVLAGRRFHDKIKIQGIDQFPNFSLCQVVKIRHFLFCAVAIDFHYFGILRLSI